MVHRHRHRKIFQSHSCLTVLKALGWLSKVVYRVMTFSLGCLAANITSVVLLSFMKPHGLQVAAGLL